MQSELKQQWSIKAAFLNRPGSPQLDISQLPILRTNVSKFIRLCPLNSPLVTQFLLPPLITAGRVAEG